MPALPGGRGLLASGFHWRTKRLADAVWWILGPLLLMPAKVGMPLFVVSGDAWKSMMGHLVYGAVTGAVYAAARRRSH